MIEILNPMYRCVVVRASSVLTECASRFALRPVSCKCLNRALKFALARSLALTRLQCAHKTNASDARKSVRRAAISERMSLSQAAAVQC